MPLVSSRKMAMPGHAFAVVAGFLLVQAALVLGAATCYAQTPVPAAPAKPSLAKALNPDTPTKPAWTELTSDQQVALGPLASGWNGISEGQKRKWIAMSRNYHGLTTTERATLHGRMTEWAALSPAQRSQARLNFAQTKELSTEEKKTRWQAYQALSADQKKQLASRAQPIPVGAAPAVTPVAPNKLAAVPVTRSESVHPAIAASRPRTPASPKMAAPASAAASQP